MNISDYKSTKIDAESIKNEDLEELKKSPEFQRVERDYGDVIQDFINNYANLSEPELMQEMLRLIAKKKQEGTFDPNTLRDVAKVVAPMLDDEARAKMYTLLNFLD